MVVVAEPEWEIVDGACGGLVGYLLLLMLMLMLVAVV